MKKNRAPERSTLLVTSAGRRNELILLLNDVCRQNGVRLITADSSREASARLLPVPFFLLPKADDSEFFKKLSDLCGCEQVKGVVSLTDYENETLSKYSSKLKKSGIRWLGSSSEAIIRADDKKQFLSICEGRNIPHSLTFSTSSQKENWIKKPAKGSRSVGVEKLNRKDVPADKEAYESSVIVEYLPGDEFTIDVLSDEKGIQMVVPRLRKQIRDGESVVGETQKSTQMENAVGRIFQALPGLRGIWNLQGFLHKGEFKVTEVNPRISGGLPLSLHAGANFFDWFISELKDDFSFEPKTWRENVTMYRYWQGVYEG